MIRGLLRLVVGVLGAVLAVRGRAEASAGTTSTSAPPSPLWTFAKRWAFRAFVVVSVLGAGGILVMILGLVPIKASSGHWAITAWILDFAKTRSVATHTLGITAPPLDDPALAMKGAGHYDYACLPCHGSPALEAPRVARQMTPLPPSLPETVIGYDAAELFYIVKHGIKFTGMPAWPALERDDEVWAMVAFLQRLPGMDAETYTQLARGPAAPSPDVPMEQLVPEDRVPAAVTQNCARCHGVDGGGRGTSAFPALDGQSAEYMRLALEAYATGQRPSGLMEPVAAALGPDEMRGLAEYYASRPPARSPEPVRGDVELGRRIALEGLPNQLVPACVSCHAPDGAARNPAYPRLEGQYAGYLHLQLTLFKERTRGGSPWHHIMERVAGQLSDEEMRAVAAYFASLPPSPR